MSVYNKTRCFHALLASQSPVLPVPVSVQSAGEQPPRSASEFSLARTQTRAWTRVKSFLGCFSACGCNALVDPDGPSPRAGHQELSPGVVVDGELLPLSIDVFLFRGPPNLSFSSQQMCPWRSWPPCLPCAASTSASTR